MGESHISMAKGSIPDQYWKGLHLLYWMILASLIVNILAVFWFALTTPQNPTNTFYALGLLDALTLGFVLAYANVGFSLEVRGFKAKTNPKK
jgi:hypothetical protein